jgi:hypothetical protein
VKEWRLKRNILSKKHTSVCKVCFPDLTPVGKLLAHRFDEIYQRCNNPSQKHYHNYGARGIECRFSSRREFVEYMLKHVPHLDYKGLQIDRKNNDGHYEPGNLRLATQREQLLNTRLTLWLTFRGQRVLMEQWPSPFAYSTMVTLYHKKGYRTGEEYIEHAKQVKRCANIPGIKKRLVELGYTTS